MITVSEIIDRLIMQASFLEEGLAEGIINISALARKFKPQIENELMKPISESAVLMALKRMVPDIQKRTVPAVKYSSSFSDLTVRSGLSEFTFGKSETIHAKRLKLMHELRDRPDYFATFTQGMYEITTILNSSFEPQIKEIFNGERMLNHLNGLAAITVRLSDEMIYVPGIHYNILKQLAWNKINVIEVVSTFTEFNIILKKEQVDKSFSILLKYFNQS